MPKFFIVFFRFIQVGEGARVWAVYMLQGRCVMVYACSMIQVRKIVFVWIVIQARVMASA